MLFLDLYLYISGVLAGGPGGRGPPVNIFRGRQKLHVDVMTQERLSEIQKLGQPKNFSTPFKKV